MKGPNPDAVLKLAEQHVEHFKGLLEMAKRGHPNVRKAECEWYLQIWYSIRAKNGVWEKLAEEERAEVRDALAVDG